jgi:hypothetical protein
MANRVSNGSGPSIAKVARSNGKARDGDGAAPSDAAAQAGAKGGPKRRRKGKGAVRAAKAARRPPGEAGRGRDAEGGARKRTRLVRSFPAAPFEEALSLAAVIQEHGAGQRIRRLTLFDYLGKSPESGWSRQLVTNSNRYGLTAGSHAAEYIELTPLGRVATSQEVSPRERIKARFHLAVEQIEPFRQLYEQYQGTKLPAIPVLKDFLVDAGYQKAEVGEAVETFIANAKFVGILRNLSGAERLVSIDHALDELPAGATRFATEGAGAAQPAGPDAGRPAGVAGGDAGAGGGGFDWDKTCFYVTPIGADGSPERRHSDLFLGSLIEPAVAEFGLRVVRADHIAAGGLITRQVLEAIVRSRVVVADLSYHNANVFYELALRHATGRPAVQIIRQADAIPFDVGQVRTILIDTTDLHTFVPQMEVYKAAISSQVRRALEAPEAVDNPVTSFYPEFRLRQGVAT